MREFIIQKSDAGQRLDRYLGKVLSNAPQGLIYKSLRKKRVKVNGKKGEAAYRLCEGDRLLLYINDEFFQAGRPAPYWQTLQPKLDVVYEDADILVANKPSGLLSQAENEPSLEGYYRAYLYQKGELDPSAAHAYLPSLCHRIDRNTAGLVLAAKHAEAHRILSQKLRDREIRKFYRCETEGVPEPKSGTVSGYLLKSPAERRMRFFDTPRPGAVPCSTSYRVLREDGRTAVVEVELHTGRTHQIRATFAYLGCPLAGDVKYGAEKDGRHTYQHLTACRLVFAFTSDAGILNHLSQKVIVI